MSYDPMSYDPMSYDAPSVRVARFVSILPRLADLQPAVWTPQEHKWLPGQAREP